MSALIQLTLDGSLVLDGHRVSMRVLGNSMVALQGAADRAYLDVRYGTVWKHQRLHFSLREKADFIVGTPYEGSYVIEFLSSAGTAIVERIRAAVRDPYGKAVAGGNDQIFSITHQIEARKGALANKIFAPQEYKKFLETPDDLITRTYGDKSINKEINEMLTYVRNDADALVKLVLKPSENDAAETFEFNRETALAFQKIIKHRQLGNPVLYRGELRELDHGHKRKSNFKGKFINSENDKDVVIHIQSEEDFQRLVPHLGGVAFSIVACPIIEYSSYDQVAGDIQFLDILEDV